MRIFWLAGVGLLSSALPAMAQQAGIEAVQLLATTDTRDFVVAKGVRQRTEDQPEVIDVILPVAPEGLTLAHPAEILNTVAGVNIHRNGLLEAPTEIASRIETFKGPGPADYGSNAVHGLINVVLNGPGGGGEKVSVQASSRGYSGFDQQKLVLQHRAELGDWDVDSLIAVNNLNQETAGFLQGDDAYLDREVIETNNFPEAFRDTQALRAQIKATRETDIGTLILQPYANIPRGFNMNSKTMQTVLVSSKACIMIIRSMRSSSLASRQKASASAIGPHCIWARAVNTRPMIMTT